MERKILQIAASAEGLFVLSSDGKIFFFSRNSWHELPPIPQIEDRAGQIQAAMQERIADLAIQFDLSPAERADLEAKLLRPAQAAR